MTFKRVSTLLLVALTVVTLSLDANARKFGGGKSFGKSFRTAPHNSLTQRPTSQSAGQKGVASNVRRPGIMGGLLGGLLAGGLFAWLLGSGAFHGLQIMDMLIIAVIAFIGFRILRAMMQAKAVNAQANGSAQQPWQTRSSPEPFEPTNHSFAAESASPTDDVPFDIPKDLDISGFLEGSRGHYNIIQTAWNHNDLPTIRDYVAPELYQQLVDERAKLGSQPLSNQILYVEASLVRAQCSKLYQQLSVHFIGKYKDTQSNEQAIDEIWHLRRSADQANADWLIEGIEERGE
ncbi:Tim44 domain-containing protein [Celerinatantimonas yamalensis]|uniref:TIM44-like domain-containing protein n=1 Tax=Celerinatantimonas yamalensis TaxID=559956 RepID=A0ABW9GBX4_9GAMM